MKEHNVGYAVQVRNRSTGKTGYWSGGGHMSDGKKYTFLRLVNDPAEFLGNIDRNTLVALKGGDLELEGFVRLNAIAIEKTVTKEDAERFEMLDKATGNIHKQTIKDVLGEKMVQFIYNELSDAGHLRPEFDKAVAGRADLQYVGSVILDSRHSSIYPEDKVIFSAEGYSKREPHEMTLKAGILGKYLTGNSVQDRHTGLHLSDVFARNTGNEIKLAGVYVRVAEDHAYNWDKTRIKTFLESHEEAVQMARALAGDLKPQ